MKHAIELKKYVENNRLAYQQLVGCPDVMLYITGHGLNSKESNAKFDDIMTINNQQEATGYFQILDSNTKTILGECKLVDYRDDPMVFEIGYLLKKEYWKQGIGSQVVRHLLKRAELLNPEKDILGIIHPENQASKRLLEKFSFSSIFLGVENGMPTEKLILHRKR